MEQFEIGLTVQNAIGNGGVSIGDVDRTVITIGEFCSLSLTRQGEQGEHLRRTP